MDKLKELIEFPTIHTFKIVGDNTPSFTFGVEEIFNKYQDKTVSTRHSGEGRYISLSVTVNVKDYEELKNIYSEISKLQGLKFHA